jgi:hypothetical protein
MANENEFNLVFERIVGDFRNLHDFANKKAKKVVPFGNIEVKPKNVQAHLAKLTVEQRKELMQDPKKREQVLEAFRRQGGPVFAPLAEDGI